MPEIQKSKSNCEHLSRINSPTLYSSPAQHNSLNYILHYLEANRFDDNLFWHASSPSPSDTCAHDPLVTPSSAQAAGPSYDIGTVNSPSSPIAVITDQTYDNDDPFHAEHPSGLGKVHDCKLYVPAG
jgi:hypothetical protein